MKHNMKPYSLAHSTTLLLTHTLSQVLHQTGRARRTFLRGLAVLVALGFVIQMQARADEVQNAPELAGFRGQVTGTVKSTQPDKPSFVLAISKAEADPAASTLKDGAPLLGKELTLGVRMPRNADGVGAPHPDDIAYIKTLKPGMLITVKIFSVHNNPRVLRIQGPGQPAKGT
jgi:hypothetical protein